MLWSTLSCKIMEKVIRITRRNDYLSDIKILIALLYASVNLFIANSVPHFSFVEVPDFLHCLRCLIPRKDIWNGCNNIRIWYIKWGMLFNILLVCSNSGATKVEKNVHRYRKPGQFKITNFNKIYSIKHYDM